MHDLDIALIEAWQLIQPMFEKNPDELAQRLSRRRQPSLQRPPRAWCLAVRASDTRINPATAAIVPEHALRLDCHIRPYCFGEHEVTLDARLLRRLCQAVHIDPPGEDWQFVARKLGCHEESLRPAMRKGILEVHYIKNLGGKSGKPVPVVYSPETFDPSASNFHQRPDPIWGAMWQHLTDLVPDDLDQPIVRRPVYHPYGAGRRFRGWRWVCPGCRREVRTIFYPLPVTNLPEFFGIDPAKTEFDAPHRPPPCFACVRCHRVRYFSRLDSDSWNHLVAHLSGHLLYGHEVPRPPWLTPDRRRPYRPHLMRPPSKRREEVLQRLLKGWAYQKIARDLGVGFGTVHIHVKKIYKQHRVRGREELARQLGITLPPRLSAKREEVRRRLEAGQPLHRIVGETGLTLNAVNHHMRNIRRFNPQSQSFLLPRSVPSVT